MLSRAWQSTELGMFVVRVSDGLTHPPANGLKDLVSYQQPQHPEELLGNADSQVPTQAH